MGVASKPRSRGLSAFRALDGSHPLRLALPEGQTSYHARPIAGAEVVWFNHALAREMGLIPAGRPERLDAELRRAVLDAFALQIVNEWDLHHGPPLDPTERLPGPYMATRYLQLQHPGRTGRTSGDGRSVWIGTAGGPDGEWDISACGTGVTHLCPATAWSGRFYRTGSRAASYGCGTATVQEGLGAALMSEALHREGVQTERVLAVIGLGGGRAINVRAGRNLLRPAHFFLWSKRGDIGALRRLAEYHDARERARGLLRRSGGGRRWERLTAELTRGFARQAAIFESEYLFVWLDWDGDNILMNGGILDYGSVRQFGLYHRDYRYDDATRWSTTIPEQRRKARLIVQNFAQIRDMLERGRKRPLAEFKNDRAVRQFDTEFERFARLFLLRRIGFDASLAERLRRGRGRELERFRAIHGWFERVRSARGPRRVNDGITWNAVYSTRDLLRELPARYLAQGGLLEPREILAIAASSYSTPRDRRLTPYRARRAREFQRAYLALIQAAARLSRRSTPLVLTEVAARSAVLNRFTRITGDAVVHAAARLTRAHRRLGADAVHDLIRRFVEAHTTNPDLATTASPPAPKTPARRIFDALLSDTEQFRHGI